MSWDEWLADQARARSEAGLNRLLRPRSGSEAMSGQINLAGNDYLNLSTDPRLIDAAVAATRRWGTGSTGSRLVTGTTELHLELESALADLTGQQSGLVFSSGYLANLGAVAGLADADTLIVSDAHVHASLVDACRLSRARVAVVPHNDVDAVAAALSDNPLPRALVLAESIYSVLGDAAPLVELAQICDRYGALLLVDEAHGLGVTGGGRGSVAAAGLNDADHVLVTATLSKSLGSQGGVVLGSAAVRDHLINRARSFIFDTALAPAPTAAALAAVRIVESTPSLAGQIATVTAALAEICGVEPVPGAVLSVAVPGPQEAVAAAEWCATRGVRVGSFRPPSVPDGVSRVRMTAAAKLGAPENAADLARAGQVIGWAIGGAIGWATGWATGWGAATR